MSRLKISLVQSSLFWEDRAANLQMFSEILDSITSNPDLIILPEMFATGFTMKPELHSEKESGPSIVWMKKWAVKKQSVITGSLVIEESGKYFNRLFWVRPDGSFKTYDKRHLFSLVGEQNHFEAGKERLIVSLKGFKIMPLICYDLRFPVWSRNDVNYDVLIYVANWPERRSFFWKSLLVARAIENQSFVLGVNRVGKDGNAIYHSGDSVCLGPLGNEIDTCLPGKEQVMDVVITKEELSTIRSKFRFLEDKDEFKVIT